MCQRCKDMATYWRERIKEAQQMFPPDNEGHIKELMAGDPTLDEAALRALFASRAGDYPLAVACLKASLEFLHSNSGCDPGYTLGLASTLIGRLAHRQQDILTMQSGSDGGTSSTPEKKPEKPNGEKLH